MKIKLLLVDDERDFLETLSKRLEARGFSVRSVLNGEEALVAVKEGGIDVVILDVCMPGLDGITTLHEIKRARPLVEVVMLTGHFSVQKAVHGMQTGAFDYIMKPAAIDDLLEKITAAHRRKSEREGRIRNAEI